MIPKWKFAKLGITFGKAVLKHREKILHITDVELLVRDLGSALDEQKNMLTNPRNSTIETAFELLPQIAEVRVLTNVIAAQLKLETKDKDHLDVLKDIVEEMAKVDSNSAFDIKNNLSWMEEFYSIPEVNDLMSNDIGEIEVPSSIFDIKGAGKMLSDGISKAFDKTQQYHKYMQLAKKFEQMQKRKLAEKENNKKPPEDKKGGKGPKNNGNNP